MRVHTRQNVELYANVCHFSEFAANDCPSPDFKGRTRPIPVTLGHLYARNNIIIDNSRTYGKSLVFCL